MHAGQQVRTVQLIARAAVTAGKMKDHIGADLPDQGRRLVRAGQVGGTIIGKFEVGRRRGEQIGADDAHAAFAAEHPHEMPRTKATNAGDQGSRNVVQPGDGRNFDWSSTKSALAC